MAINLSQQRFLQPLRSNILGSYGLAVSALENVAAEIAKTDATSQKADGSTIVARYTDGSVVKSIFGIYEHSTKKITIYSHDDEKLQGLLDGLDGRLDVIEGEGKGSIKKAVADAKFELVDGASAGYQTLKELQTKIEALDGAVGEGGSVSTQIQNAINLLDSTATSTNGQLVNITVVEADGKLSSASVDESGLNTKIAAIEKSVSDEQARAEGAEEQLGKDIAAEATKAREEEGKLAQAIADVSADAKSYKIVAITEGLETNVKEAWKLVDEDEVQAGDTIKIYKDSSLKSVALVEQELQFTYILADGSESTVGVDVSSFLAESEFKNGLQVVDHVVSVKLAEGSESFLSVGEEGVKLSGVQDAIDAAVKTEKDRAELAEKGLSDRLSALETGENSVAKQIENAINGLDSEKTGDGAYVDVTVKQVDGVITEVSVDESGLNTKIAAIEKSVSDEQARAEGVEEQLGKDIAAETQRAEGAESALSGRLDVIEGNGDGSIEKAVSDVKSELLGDAAEEYNTLGKLEDKIQAEAQRAASKEGELAEAIAAQSAAAKTEVVEGTTNDMLSVSKEDAEDGHAIYTVDLSNVWDCGEFTYQPEA